MADTHANADVKRHYQGAAPLLGSKASSTSHSGSREESMSEDIDLDDFDDLETGIVYYESKERKYEDGDAAAGLADWVLRQTPTPVRRYLQNMTFVKFFVLLLCLVLPIMAWMYFTRVLPRTVTVPKQAKELSKALTRDLAGSSIPSYVLMYAPYILLDDAESYFPGDISKLLKHTYPAINLSRTEGDDRLPQSLSLDNLDSLNALEGGKDVYLTSKKDLSTTPSYLHGKKPGRKSLQTKDAKSAVIIVRDLGDGVVHAFYMYFYTYNAGPVVQAKEWENHLGDWEHNMIRFENGEPQSIWYSQHIGGVAYAWNATKKLKGRPIVYVALGTHANYIEPGWHDLHTKSNKVPKGIAFDHASAGLLWDPTLSAYYYTHQYSDTKNSTSSPHTFTPALPETPVSYLHFDGHWGDKRYPNDDPRQVNFHGIVKWDSGPRGPSSKDLDRVDVCRDREVSCRPLGG